jgi:hypothetical protein
VMQFAGMNGAECLQYGGAKCITYSCVCPKLVIGLILGPRRRD